MLKVLLRILFRLGWKFLLIIDQFPFALSYVTSSIGGSPVVYDLDQSDSFYLVSYLELAVKL